MKSVVFAAALIVSFGCGGNMKEQKLDAFDALGTESLQLSVPSSSAGSPVGSPIPDSTVWLCSSIRLTDWEATILPESDPVAGDVEIFDGQHGFAEIVYQSETSVEVAATFDLCGCQPSYLSLFRSFENIEQVVAEDAMLTTTITDLDTSEILEDICILRDEDQSHSGEPGSPGLCESGPQSLNLSAGRKGHDIHVAVRLDVPSCSDPENPTCEFVAPLRAELEQIFLMSANPCIGSANENMK